MSSPKKSSTRQLASEHFAVQLKNIKQQGSERAQHVLDGAQRLRDASRKDLTRAVKEARRQIGELGRTVEQGQDRLSDLTVENQRLRSLSASLQQRLEEVETQLERLRVAVKEQVTGSTPAAPAPKAPAAKPAAKKAPARKPAAKKAPARKPAAKRSA